MEDVAAETRCVHRLYGILVEMKLLPVIKFHETKDVIYNP
jgi:hypothetical protein